MKARWWKRFAQDDRGSATIESLLWFPLFIYLLVLITDVSFIFYGKAQALRILQDGNRAYSLRYPGYQTDTEVEAKIQARLASFDPTAVPDTNFDNISGLITTTVSLNAAELMAVGAIPGFGDFQFEIIAQHFQEQ